MVHSKSDNIRGLNFCISMFGIGLDIIRNMILLIFLVKISNRNVSVMIRELKYQCNLNILNLTIESF